jgi:hypothetical protein
MRPGPTYVLAQSCAPVAVAQATVPYPGLAVPVRNTVLPSGLITIPAGLADPRCPRTG